MADTILPGYTSDRLSNKKVIVVDIDGPASYNNTGTYATSGQVLTAAELGVGGIDTILPSQSSNGLNEIAVSFTAKGGAQPSVAIHWIVTATGVEVANAVNLSATFIRVLVIAV